MGSRLDQLKKFGQTLRQLDAHDSFFLLRHCLSIPKVLYTLRSSPCFLDSASLKAYDKQMKITLEQILNVKIDDDAWTQSNLPVKFGGLGIRKALDVAVPAYMASVHQCRDLVKDIWNGNSQMDDRVEKLALEHWKQRGFQVPIKDKSCQKVWDRLGCEKQHNDILDKQDEPAAKARLLATAAEGAGDWLNAFPIPSLGLKLSSADMRIAVSLRLGLEMCEEHICLCGKKVSKTGVHGLSCSKSRGRHPRHAMVNDLMKRALSSAGIPSTLEPVGLSLADGKRPDGLTMIPWDSGKSLTWDFTCPDTLAPSHLPDTCKGVAGAANEAEVNKRKKYQGLEITHIVQPVAIETLGAYGTSAKSFLTILGRKIRITTGERNAGAYLRQAIGIAIQRGNAISVLGTLPSTKALDEVFYTF